MIAHDNLSHVNITQNSRDTHTAGTRKRNISVGEK